MYVDAAVLVYIDPNTSQHVFNLLGPILACLTAIGGFVIAVIVCTWHRIASYFRTASWTRRAVAIAAAIGTLATAAAAIIWLVLP